MSGDGGGRGRRFGSGVGGVGLDVGDVGSGGTDGRSWCVVRSSSLLLGGVVGGPAATGGPVVSGSVFVVGFVDCGYVEWTACGTCCLSKKALWGLGLGEYSCVDGEVTPVVVGRFGVAMLKCSVYEIVLF